MCLCDDENCLNLGQQSLSLKIRAGGTRGPGGHLPPLPPLLYFDRKASKICSSKWPSITDCPPQIFRVSYGPGSLDDADDSVLQLLWIAHCVKGLNHIILVQNYNLNEKFKYNSLFHPQLVYAVANTEKIMNYLMIKSIT